MSDKVKVLFEYQAQKEDELTLKVGDIVNNVDTSQDGGWWEGDLMGKRGWFPDNFVEKMSSSTKPPPPAGRGVSGKRAVVKFEYKAENSDELNLKVGDVVNVTKMEEEGWWEGELNGAVGVFPNNFVELEEEGASAPPEARRPAPTAGGAGGAKLGFGNIFQGGAPNLRKTGTFSAQNKSEFLKDATKDAKDTRELVKVTYDYAPENGDELELKSGMFIRVTKKEDEGWWEGEVDGDPSKKGMFPDNFVVPATAQEIEQQARLNKGPAVKPPGGLGLKPAPSVKKPPIVSSSGSVKKPPATNRPVSMKKPPVAKKAVAAPVSSAPASGGGGGGMSAADAKTLQTCVQNIKKLQDEVAKLNRTVDILTASLDEERQAKEKLAKIAADRANKLK
eukprot:m.108136 g.108136  ORF g.108136 m.108136 type:complete len:392 (-) comp13950_c0_seq1:164-1339(-)